MSQTQYMVYTPAADQRIMADNDDDAIRQAREWARAEITAEAEPLIDECDQPVAHEHVLEWRLEVALDGRQVAGAWLAAHVSADEPQYDADGQTIVDAYIETEFRRRP